MDENQEIQQSNVQVETKTETMTDQEIKVEEMPSLEDLQKSEKEVGAIQKTKKEVAKKPLMLGEDRVFARKSDEKKAHVKKRLKIVTAVYSTVVALLLGFVITNIATLAIMNKQITTNTKTIQSNQQQIELLEEGLTPTEKEQLPISLNEPRDYSEDKQELTFLDKVTIIFRNIFG